MSATRTLAAATPPVFGPGRVKKILPISQPQWPPRISLVLEVEGALPGVEIRVYGRSMALVGVHKIDQPMSPGWNRVDLNIGNLANGLYFARVVMNETAQPPIGKILVLR